MMRDGGGGAQRRAAAGPAGRRTAGLESSRGGLTPAGAAGGLDTGHMCLPSRSDSERARDSEASEPELGGCTRGPLSRPCHWQCLPSAQHSPPGHNTRDPETRNIRVLPRFDVERLVLRRPDSKSLVCDSEVREPGAVRLRDSRGCMFFFVYKLYSWTATCSCKPVTQRFKFCFGCSNCSGSVRGTPGLSCICAHNAHLEGYMENEI